MKRNEIVVLALLVVAFALWAPWHAARDTRLRAENAVLKQQIAEWQKASAQAISARSWWTKDGAVQAVEDLKPEHLERALNPCYTTPSGDVNTEAGLGCVTFTDFKMRANPVSIKIVRTDR